MTRKKHTTEGREKMYSKSHLLTDLYKVKQDLRHIYNHGSQYLVSTSISAIKSMIYQLEDIDRIVRLRKANGDPDPVDDQSNNGTDNN